jgi:hypothetical protein
MSTTPPEANCPVSLQDFLDLYNNKQINVDELLKKTIPLLQREHDERILQYAAVLLSNNPAFYHLSSSHHAEILKDAEMAYKAHIYAELTMQPGELARLLATCRRVEAKLNQDQPVKQ